MIGAKSFGLPTVYFLNIPCKDIIYYSACGLVIKEKILEAFAYAIKLLIKKEDLRNELRIKNKKQFRAIEKPTIAKLLYVILVI